MGRDLRIPPRFSSRAGKAGAGGASHRTTRRREVGGLGPKWRGIQPVRHRLAFGHGGLSKAFLLPFRFLLMLPNMAFRLLRALTRDLFSWGFLGIGLLGFLMGRARLLGSVNPFGLAYTSVIIAIYARRAPLVNQSREEGGISSLIGLIGVCIGVVTLTPLLDSLDYIIGLVSAYFIIQRLKILWKSSKGSWESTRFLIPLTLLPASVIPRIVARSLLGLSGASPILLGVEGVMASILSFIVLWVDFEPQGSSGAAVPWARIDPLSLMVIASGVIAGLAGVRLCGFSIGDLLAGVVILATAFTGGSILGVFAGLFTGLSCSMVEGAIGAFVGAYALGGLASGVLRYYDKIGAAAGFILGGMVLSFQIPSGSAVPIFVGELFVSSAIFLCLPRKLLYRMRVAIPRDIERDARQNVCEPRLQELIAERLVKFATVLEELSRSLETIPDGERLRESATIFSMLSQVVSGSCGRCTRHLSCWVDNFYRTYMAMVDLLALTEIKERVAACDLEGSMDKWCIQPHRLIESVNSLWRSKSASRHWDRKLREGRKVVSIQLKGISDIMRRLVSELSAKVEFEEELEKLITRKLARFGFTLESVNILAIRGGRGFEVVIRKEACKGDEECKKAIAPIISNMLGEPLTLNSSRCGTLSRKGFCEFRLCSPKQFEVEAEVVKVAKDRSSVSGDAHVAVELPNGKFLLALSDGMGVGPKAALESNATISMLRHLIEAGFDHEFVVKTVNSLLLLRSPGESFATVDLAVIDLYTGEVEFVKVGSSPSFIKHGGEVEGVGLGSLPAGILNSIEVERVSRRLDDGDVIVMVSDGILESRKDVGGREGWIFRAIRRSSGADLYGIARSITEKARGNAGGVLRDDATVLVARMKRKGRARKAATPATPVAAGLKGEGLTRYAT